MRHGRVLRRNIERLGVTAQCAVEGRPVAGVRGTRAPRGFADEHSTSSSTILRSKSRRTRTSASSFAFSRGTARSSTNAGDDRIPRTGRTPDDVRRYGRTRLLFYRA